MRKMLLAPAVAAAMIFTGSAPALAAAAERETIQLTCNNGETFQVEVNGNGAFTPGRLVGSTRVLIPIAFGDFTFRAVLPNGEVRTGSEPAPDAKGGGNVARRSPRPQVTCTFAETFTLPEADMEFGLPAGTVVTFGGEVTGFLTGRR